MDSVIFQAMAVEVNRKFSGSRLDKIVQVSAGTLVFKLWTGREKVQLLFKADGRGVFHQTGEAYPAPVSYTHLTLPTTLYSCWGGWGAGG